MLQRRLFNALMPAAVMACGVKAHAQSYAARPIRIIIPIGAGGVLDVLTRVVTDRVQQSLGQGFVIENRGGAGGNIGMEAVAHAAPDGYTLLVNGPSMAINPSLYRKLAFDPVKDLVPVAMLGSGPFAVFVSGRLPVKNVAEFIAYAKSAPGKLNYASIGAGSAAHLSSVLFCTAAGIDMTHVPYKAIQQAVADLVSGSVHMVFNAYPPLAPLLQDGKLKLLGFASPRRLSALPEVPTLAESGLPGFEAGGWYIAAVPAGTPRDIQQRLNTEFVRALKQPDVAAAVVKLGWEPLTLGLDETQRFFGREVEKWGSAVRASGASAE
ncbi:MAG: Tricarboxylate transport protein TctC [Polaromonas sp.]|nr:Tricarboxylate transport protein TctC [Polaromonas sp.]